MSWYRVRLCTTAVLKKGSPLVHVLTLMDTFHITVKVKNVSAANRVPDKSVILRLGFTSGT